MAPAPGVLGAAFREGDVDVDTPVTPSGTVHTSLIPPRLSGLGLNANSVRADTEAEGSLKAAGYTVPSPYALTRNS